MMSLAMPVCNCCANPPANRSGQPLPFPKRRNCVRENYSHNPPLSPRVAAFVQLEPDYCTLRRNLADQHESQQGDNMLSVVEMRPSTAANSCRPLSLPPRLGGLLLGHEDSDSGSQASQANQPCAGGKLPTAKASRSHLSFVERAQSRRPWHLNGARDRLASLSIALATSTSRNAPENAACSANCEDRNNREENLSEQRSASRILPFLFIGGEQDARDLNKLEAMGIGYVLNVTGDIPCHFEGRPGFVYKRIPADDCDEQNLKLHFHTAIDFIERARQAGVACLVHCLAGVSRSPTIVLAYLMSTRGWSMNDAYKFVKERRNWIAPNFSFFGQLCDLECELQLRSERPPSADSGCNSEHTESEHASSDDASQRHGSTCELADVDDAYSDALQNSNTTKETLH